MKRHYKIGRNHRGGVSVAVALIMAVVLMVAFIQNVLILGQGLTAEESDRVHEAIAIQEIYMNLDSELTISVQNTGGVVTRLIAVWVESTNSSTETQRVTIDEYVGVKEVQLIVLDPSVLDASNMTDPHTFTVVTERGNFASGEFPVETLPHIHEVRYLGVFGIDWFYCKYASQQNPPNGSERSDAVYIVKSEDYIAFYLNVTNSYDHPVGIRKESFLSLTTIAPSQGAGVPTFFLVQNVSYSPNATITKVSGITAYDDNDPFIVFPNQSRVLVFAAEADGSNGWQWGFGYPFGPETTTDGSDVQISLFYELFDDDELTPTGKLYGQAISTHAVTLLAK